MIRMLNQTNGVDLAATTPYAPKSSVVQRVVLPDVGEVQLKGRDSDSLTLYLSELTGALGAAFDVRPATTTPQDFVLLRSPAGHVFQVKVSDAGALSATMIYQKT